LREKLDEGFMEKTQSIDFSMKGQSEKKGQSLLLFIAKIATQDTRFFAKDEQVDPLPPPTSMKKSQTSLQWRSFKNVSEDDSSVILAPLPHCPYVGLWFPLVSIHCVNIPTFLVGFHEGKGNLWLLAS
jgi:hypothetical protein